MPDISMCNGKKCPKKKQCYRYMAIPDRYQSYAMFEESCLKDKKFENFWSIEGRRNIREK